jgi:hypothetical protein
MCIALSGLYIWKWRERFQQVRDATFLCEFKRLAPQQAGG